MLKILLLCSFIPFKTPVDELNYYETKYPDQSVVVLKHYRTLDLTLINDSVVVSSYNYQEIIYLKDNATSYAKDMLYSSSFAELSQVNAYSLIPSKKKYDELKVEQFNESFDKDSYVFFDDHKEITFYYPGLIKGAKSVVEYRQTITDPHMISSFYMQSHLPTAEVIYTVTYDPSIQIKPHLFNNLGIDIKQKKEQIDGKIRLTFSSSQVTETKFEPRSPAIGHLIPSVFIQVEQFTDSQGQSQSILGTVGDLYRWYQTFIQDIPASAEMIKAILPEIINNQDDNLTKLKKIYYWVQSNIKYVAFEQGMRGLIPHSGEYVLEKRYGDCKDMSSLLVSLLNEAGLNAKYTWIGTRDINHKYSITPSPIVDNHMIATCQLDNNLYFLDATGQYTPLDYPTSMIQGKECLIADGENYRLINVPIIDKSKNFIHEEYEIELIYGALIGYGKATLTGYPKVFSTAKLIKANAKSKDNYLNRLLGKGSNKFLSKNYKIDYLNDIEKPIEIKYDFEIKDYYQMVGNDIYINLILDQTLVDDIIEKRQNPIENEYKYTNVNICHLNIPQDYSVSHQPDNETYDSDIFGFNIKYELIGKQLVVTKEFYIDHLILFPEQFEQWNIAIQKYSEASRQVVILSKIH